MTLWNRREFLRVAGQALKIACAVALVPSIASAATESLLATSQYQGTAHTSKFDIRVSVEPYRGPVAVIAWIITWQFTYRGTDYDCSSLWDIRQLGLSENPSPRAIERAMIRKTAPLFEAAMKRKLRQVAA